MTITDKLDQISDADLESLSIFVHSMATEIRKMAEYAANEGVTDVLIWLLDCRDEVGVGLAREWQVEGVVNARSIDEMPYAITRAVSYEKAHEAFTRMPVDIEIPKPRPTHIDILAVTGRRIFVRALPRDPEQQDLWPGPGEILTVVSGLEKHLAAPTHDLMIQAIVEPVSKSSEGELIRALALPWVAIVKEIEKDPDFLYRFAKHPRKFEEFIAATYARDGWPEVILTPRSGDGGIDVIATKPGAGSVRFLDQCKARSPGRLVSREEVSAMLGVLKGYSNASKGVITTTSDFAPGIQKADLLKQFLPHRLELRAGSGLRSWLASLLKRHSGE